MAPPPKKLKKDAIAEALCEVRFECEESTSLPETVVSKLADFEPWRHFEKIRLATSDIPASLRSQVPDLKNQPVLVLREQNGSRLAKIGANVVSYHRLAPYPGWEIFKPEVESTVDYIFQTFRAFRATRLGFRYVNLFTDDDHGITTVANLNYSVHVAGEPLHAPQNLNYRLVRSDDHVVQVRIATPEFVSGSIDKSVHVLADLDVFTPRNFGISSAEAAKKWIKDAHDYEKEEFFKLFTDKMRARLVEVE
jgi:uncharacterized protein (TIGR04255 family)